VTSTLPPYIQAASGSLGAALANGITYPLDLVVTRLQLTRRAKNYPGGKLVVQTTYRLRSDESLTHVTTFQTLPRPNE
jgi:hypothetical protein